MAASSVTTPKMQYSRLGNSGLIVSRLALGSWVTFGPQVDETSAYSLMKAAYAAGVNFFDNAGKTVHCNVLRFG